MATTPDEKPFRSTQAKVVEEVRKATTQYSTRAAISVAAFFAVGTDRIEAAIPLSILLFVVGGKR
jgi:hypothetical protein